MIETHLKVRTANDGEDGNGLRYGFLKKHQAVSFSKVQVRLKNRKFLLHKFRNYFVNL